MSELLEHRIANSRFLASNAQTFYGPGRIAGIAPAAGGTIARLVVFTFLAAILLSPPIQLSRHFPYFRLEQLLLLLVGYGYLLGVLMRAVSPQRFSYLYVWGVLFSVLQIVSLLYGASVLQHQVVRSDYYEVLKVWLVVALFIVGYEARLGEPALRRFFAALGFCTFAVCLFGVAQYLGWSGAETLNPYFATAEHNIRGLTQSGRVYSTFGNANVLGQFLSAAAVCFMLAFLARVGRRLWTGPLGLFVMFCLILTGSRYALVVLVLGLLLLMLGAVTDPRQLLKVASAIILISIFVWILLGTTRGPFIHSERYQELRNPLEESSLRTRIDIMWREGWDEFRISPIVGHGPVKHIFTGTGIDSEYLDILRRYGLLGFTAYISIFLWILLKLKRGLRFTRGLKLSLDSPLRASSVMVQAGFILVVMDLLMNVGMSTYTNFQFGSFFWLFMGVAVRSAEFVGDVSGSIMAFPAARTCNAPSTHAPLYPSSGTLISRN